MQKLEKHQRRSWRGWLGPLQQEIMHFIFRFGTQGMLVSDLHKMLGGGRRIAKSSVYTVLNRLIQRGLLERKKVKGYIDTTLWCKKKISVDLVR